MLSTWSASAQDASSSSPAPAAASDGPTPSSWPARARSVVVNDVGTELDGTGGGTGPAVEVVGEIEAAGGQAMADNNDVADWNGAAALVQGAIDHFGRLDAVVNNAGIVRDRMFANASEDEWDAVVRVHLKGHFAVARHAAAHWRDLAKAGETPDARIINTSSGAGILGSIGQAAYSAAKGGIATLTLVQAAELGRYGVTANALAPSARTRMTEGVFDTMAKPDDPEAFDAMAPENVSPLVAWLASTASAARHRSDVRGGGRQGRHRRRLAARPHPGQGRSVGSRGAHRRGRTGSWPRPPPRKRSTAPTDAAARRRTGRLAGTVPPAATMARRSR